MQPTGGESDEGTTTDSAGFADGLLRLKHRRRDGAASAADVSQRSLHPAFDGDFSTAAVILHPDHGLRWTDDNRHGQ